MPIQARARGTNAQQQQTIVKRAPKPDFFSAWAAADEDEENEIGIWAAQKKKNVATYTHYGEIRPRKGREWEEYVCVPHFSCPSITDTVKFKNDSLDDELKLLAPPPTPAETTDVKTLKDDLDKGKVNRQNVIVRKPPVQYDGRKARSMRYTNYRNGRRIDDEEEDDGSIRKDTQWARTHNLNDVADFPKVGDHIENKHLVLHTAHITQKPGEASSVKLCYTQGARRINQSKVEDAKRLVQDIKRANDKAKESTLDSGSTGQVGKNVSFKQMDLKQEEKLELTPIEIKSRRIDTLEQLRTINKLNPSTTRIIEKPVQKELRPVTLVLRKLSNNKLVIDDARPTSRHQNIDSTYCVDNGVSTVIPRARYKAIDKVKEEEDEMNLEDVSGLQREFAEFRMGSLLNAMNDNNGHLSKVSPFMDGLPVGDVFSHRGYSSRPILAGLERLPAKRREDMTGADRSEAHIMKQIEEIIQLREAATLHDRFVKTLPLGPPAFRPIQVKSPLQRARDTSRRRRNGSIDYDDRAKGHPSSSHSAPRTRSAHSRAAAPPAASSSGARNRSKLMTRRKTSGFFQLQRQHRLIKRTKYQLADIDMAMLVIDQTKHDQVQLAIDKVAALNQSLQSEVVDHFPDNHKHGRHKFPEIVGIKVDEPVVAGRSKTVHFYL